MNLRRVGTLVVVSALTAASCSSDDGAGPGTEPPVTRAVTTEPAATDPPATDPPPTDPPATDPPATDPPATEPPATDPPATDPPPTDPLGAAAAEDEVERLFAVWTECLEAMPECDPVEVATNYVGEYQNFVLLQASSWAEGGFSIENTASRRLQVESASVDTDAGIATVIACEEDASVLVNGEGVVVDDAFASARVEWTLVSDGSGWRGSDLNDLATAEGEENTLCVFDQ